MDPVEDSDDRRRRNFGLKSRNFEKEFEKHERDSTSKYAEPNLRKEVVADVEKESSSLEDENAPAARELPQELRRVNSLLP